MKKKIIIKSLCLILAAVFICGAASGCSHQSTPYIVTDVSSVPSMKEEISITFNATNAKFSKGITADNITLSGAFEGMDLKVNRTAKDTVIITLSGEMRTDSVYNVHTYGYVFFNEGSFSAKDLALSKSIYIISPDCYIHSNSLEYKDGTLSGVIDISGYEVADTVSTSDVTIDGKAVESAELRDGNIAFTVKTSASDIDAAIAEINGKEIVVKASVLNAKNDYVFSRIFSEASLLCQGSDLTHTDDDEMTATFTLIPLCGSFADNIGKQSITLSGELADATIKSVTVANDAIELVITFPVSLYETFDSDPTVLINFGVGTLVNEWNTTNTNIKPVYVHAESQLDLNSSSDFATVAAFCDKISSSPLTKALSKLCPEAGMAISIVTSCVSAAYDICKLTGVVSEGESDLDIICRQFTEISAQLRAQDAKLDKILNALQEQELDKLRDQTFEFTTQILALETAAAEISNYIKDAANDEKILNSDGIDKNMAKVTVPTSSLGNIPEKLLQSYARYESSLGPASITDKALLSTLTTEEQTAVKDWGEYYDNLLQNLAAQSSAGNPRYKNYNKVLDDLMTKFRDVCTTIKSSGGNYFAKYDKLCSSIYLFDVTSLSARRLYRATAQGALEHAMALFIQIYNPGSTSETISTDLKNLITYHYTPAMSIINSNTANRDWDYYDQISGLTGRLTFYPQTVSSNFISCRYARISADFGFKNVYYASDTNEVEKDVIKYFEKMKKLLFMNTLDSSEAKETMLRLRKLGYDNFSNIADCMGQEVNLIANELYYSTTNGFNPCVYLSNYGSVTVSWKDINNGSMLRQKRMEITFHDATLYNIDTGEKLDTNSYTMSWDEKTWDNVYILFMSSTH